MPTASATAVGIDYDERLKRLRSRLRRKKIDAILISRPENRRYLSGYRATDHGVNETSGLLFIPARGRARLLTDFRYQLQAEEETSLPVTLYQKGVLALLNDLLGENGIRRFAFESHYTLHSFGVKLATMAEKHKIELVPVTDFVEQQRLIKSEEEIELLRRSTAFNEAVFSHIYERLNGDMTEIEAAAAIESRMRKSGAEGPSFSTIVASGENGALPHAVPTDKVIGKDQGVTIDMGLVLDGYCSDMTRNFVLGTADQTYTRIHRIVREAQLAGIVAVKPGRQMREVDRAARKVIADSGYGKYFGHALGHGVGLAVHEAPSLSFRSRQKLKPGMIVTIEPGIYIPGWGGVRLENLAVVREDGCEVLNRNTTFLDI
ncbi:MAG: Xaa-Pro peptidase family protein [Desulfofustis sp.]|nr:Xaa-Pro peptidase family protein [Desulfofustis sp.]NNF47365.1 aminopeptidase P family protein [Desulfofustis sp.]RZW21038.1 MAG: aminopeptidase P family protein [Desulfobulbaceae bacterium]